MVMYERRPESVCMGTCKQLIYMLTMPLSIWTVTVRIKGLQNMINKLNGSYPSIEKADILNNLTVFIQSIVFMQTMS